MVGIKSTALKLGDRTKPWLIGFYGGTLALIALSGLLAGIGSAFLALLLPAAVHLGWQVWALDTDDAKNCLAKFRSNRHFGWLILLAIVAGQVL